MAYFFHATVLKMGSAGPLGFSFGINPAVILAQRYTQRLAVSLTASLKLVCRVLCFA
jgi:hypothetical protein